MAFTVLAVRERTSDTVKRKYRSNYNHLVMLFGNGFGHCIIETLPESNRAVATASSVIFDISIICLKFGIRLVSMLSRQTRLLGNQTLCSWPL